MVEEIEYLILANIWELFNALILKFNVSKTDKTYFRNQLFFKQSRLMGLFW